MSDKDKVIRQIYYDPDGGFGSINVTYKQAHHILNNITVNYVKEFLNKQKPRQTKSYSGFNSYVAKEPLQEIQIDLAIFTDWHLSIMVIHMLLQQLIYFQKSVMQYPLKMRNHKNR